MKYITIYLSTLVIGICACTTTAHTGSQSLENEITQIENGLLQGVQIKGEPSKTYSLTDRMKHYHVPGLSITIVKNGKIRWAKTYGYANNNLKSNIDEHTLLQAASVTKPITALGILKLVQDGLIDLDEEANTYLKDWKIEDNEFTNKEKVTVRRLLTHTAGLNARSFDGYSQADQIPSTIEILSGQGNSERVIVRQTPGTDWNYSGGGYVILQKLIEDVSRLTFEDYMEQEILIPLEMTNSTFQQPLDNSLKTNVSSGHNLDGEVIEGKWRNYPERGAGGLWTTSTDLAKYCINIYNILSGKEKGILSKKTIESMLTKHENDWGLGPMIKGNGQSLQFAHDGRNEGFFADFTAFPYEGDAVIIMTNANHGGELAHEFLKSASSFYNWNSHNQRTLESYDYTIDELRKFEGRYRWVERTNYFAEMVINNGALTFEAPGFPTDTLTPIGKFEFIDINSEVEVKFLTSDNSEIAGLTWRGFEYVKLD